MRRRKTTIFGRRKQQSQPQSQHIPLGTIQRATGSIVCAKLRPVVCFQPVSGRVAACVRAPFRVVSLTGMRAAASSDRNSIDHASNSSNFVASLSQGTARDIAIVGQSAQDRVDRPCPIAARLPSQWRPFICSRDEPRQRATGG